MRKVIYNFCLLAGAVISTFGFHVSDTHASTSIIDEGRLSQEISTESLTFSDVIDGNSESLVAYHYSHSSHSSHYSHRSHYSSRF